MSIKETQTDPVGSLDVGSLRVDRGGSWNSIARGVRAAYRFHSAPGLRDQNFGFRCARVQNVSSQVQAEPVQSAKAAREREPQRTEPGGAAALLHWQAETAERLPLPPVPNFILRSDAGHLEISALTRPSWADSIGHDAYGLWAEFTLEDISQRLALDSTGTVYDGLAGVGKGTFFLMPTIRKACIERKP